MTDLPSIAAREAATRYEEIRAILNTGPGVDLASQRWLCGEVSRLTAALATARAEGFEAGKEAAAKVVLTYSRKLRKLDAEPDHKSLREIATSIRALLASEASPAGILKRGDQ